MEGKGERTTPATCKVAGGGSFSTTTPPLPHLQLSTFLPDHLLFFCDFFPSMSMLTSSHFSSGTRGTWEGNKRYFRLLLNVQKSITKPLCVCTCVCQGIAGCACTAWSDPFMHVKEAALRARSLFRL